MENPSAEKKEYLEEISEIDLSIVHEKAFSVPGNTSCMQHLADLHYRKGILYFLLEDYRESLKCFDDAINLKQDYAEAYYQKGEIFRSHINDSKKAVEVLDKAIEINSNYAKAYDLRGFALMDLEDYHAAVESFDHVIRINLETKHKFSPVSFDLLELDHPNGYGAKALALEKLEEWEKILECYNKLLEYQPGSAHHNHGKGKALSKLERYQEAIEYFNISLKIQPNNPLFLESNGLALAHLGDRESVENNYNRLLKLASTTFNGCDHVFYFQKGIAMKTLGNKISALECFEKAISIKYDYTYAYLHKLLILEEEAEYSKAVQCVSELIRIEPNNADFYNSKGWWLSKLGEHNDALEYINKSLSLDPKNSNTYHSKGFTLSALGRYGEAIEYFNEAIKIDINCKDAHEDKQKAIKALDDIGSDYLLCQEKDIRKEGEATGIKIGKIDLVKNMLENNADINFVKNVSKLSEVQLKIIQNNQDKDISELVNLVFADSLSDQATQGEMVVAGMAGLGDTEGNDVA